MDKPLTRTELILKKAEEVNRKKQIVSKPRQVSHASSKENNKQPQLAPTDDSHASVPVRRSGRKLTASRRLFDIVDTNRRPAIPTSTPKVNRKVSGYFNFFHTFGMDLRLIAKQLVFHSHRSMPLHFTVCAD